MLKQLSLALIICALVSPGTLVAQTMVSVESAYSASKTADRFANIVESKGLTLFARIDHQKNAAGIELELRPTELIIFGNPKVGTPLMQCQQSVAIDLPQKVLVSEDADGKVWLSYNKPSYLKGRHAIEGCDDVIEKISGVLSKLTKAASTLKAE